MSELEDQEGVIVKPPRRYLCPNGCKLWNEERVRLVWAPPAITGDAGCVGGYGCHDCGCRWKPGEALKAKPRELVRKRGPEVVKS